MWYPATEDAVDPANEPVSLQEAKLQTRTADFNDDDAYLQMLITTARDYVEGYCSARFAERSAVAKCTSFDDFCHLPIAPVTDVETVQYVDTDGATQTLADTVYELRGDAIVLKYAQNWPAIQPRSLITLTATVGFSACPPRVKHAMRLWIAEAYLNRESAKLDDWSTMDALLCNDRYY
jgi:uncharacterized phiE125 gp8 family phage protein